MRYLVVATEGPGFASAEEALVVLEKLILPTFDVMMKLERMVTTSAGSLLPGKRRVDVTSHALGILND